VTDAEYLQSKQILYRQSEFALFLVLSLSLGMVLIRNVAPDCRHNILQEVFTELLDAAQRIFQVECVVINEPGHLLKHMMAQLGELDDFSDVLGLDDELESTESAVEYPLAMLFRR